MEDFSELENISKSLLECETYSEMIEKLDKIDIPISQIQDGIFILKEAIHQADIREIDIEIFKKEIGGN